MPDDNEINVELIPAFHRALAVALGEFRKLEQVYLDEKQTVFNYLKEGKPVWEVIATPEYLMVSGLIHAKLRMVEEMVNHAVALNRLIVQHNSAVRTYDEYMNAGS